MELQHSDKVVPSALSWGSACYSNAVRPCNVARVVSFVPVLLETVISGSQKETRDLGVQVYQIDFNITNYS